MGGISISLPMNMKIYREAVFSTAGCCCIYSSQFLAFGDWPITNPIEVFFFQCSRVPVVERAGKSMRSRAEPLKGKGC